jgi:hypothetical protein
MDSEVMNASFIIIDTGTVTDIRDVLTPPRGYELFFFAAISNYSRSILSDDEAIWIMAERQAISPLLLWSPELCRDHDTEEGVNYSRYEIFDGPLNVADLLRSDKVIWIADHGSTLLF